MRVGRNRKLITGAETTQVTAVAGHLGRLIVWTVGTTVVISIYDSKTTTANKVFEWVSADGKGQFELGIPILNGIHLVVSAAAAGAAVLVYD